MDSNLHLLYKNLTYLYRRSDGDRTAEAWCQEVDCQEVKGLNPLTIRRSAWLQKGLRRQFITLSQIIPSFSCPET